MEVGEKMIPKEILERYHMAEMDWYESESDFYHTFLIQTDHIPNKIIEAQKYFLELMLKLGKITQEQYEKLMGLSN